MTIASGQPATAADVLAGVNGVVADAKAAKDTATAAYAVAGGADANASAAVTAATAASADATAAQAQVGGLQQQINNVVADTTTIKTTVDTHTAQLGALANRIAALEGTAPPAVPNSPTNPTSTAVTSTSVSLSATAPAGGSAPTNYKWEYKRAVDTTYLTSSVVTLTGTQAGLIASTSYNFRVSAVNAAGPSAPSGVYTVSTAPATTLVESAHDTAVTTTNGQIVDAALNVWTLIPATGGAADFQIAINGVRQTITGAVVLMKYYNPPGAAAAGTTKHSVLQQNSFGGWYISTGVSSNIASWVQLTGDPNVVAPPPPGGAPVRAAAQGYNTQTFGPSLILSGPGQNWLRFEGAGGSGTFTNNPDGSVTIIPPNGSTDGHQWNTANFTGGYMGFTGRGFGGGGYFVARMKWANGAGISPAWWSNDMEGQTGWSLSNVPIHWPRQAANFNLWYEPDFMEAAPNDFGSAMWNNYGTSSNPISTQPLFARTSVANTNVFHDYGCLWVPATAAHDGFMAFDVDGREYGRVTWQYIANRNNLPDPPVASGGGSTPNIPTACDIDWRHIYLILGSDAGYPFDVLSVSVWQPNGNANISA